jgi:hypothetical protein
MLRAERPRSGSSFGPQGHSEPTPHDVLLAVAPPPKTSSYPLSGWPEWLIPAYRSGGHRPLIRLLEEDR